MEPADEHEVICRSSAATRCMGGRAIRRVEGVVHNDQVPTYKPKNPHASRHSQSHPPRAPFLLMPRRMDVDLTDPTRIMPIAKQTFCRISVYGLLFIPWLQFDAACKSYAAPDNTGAPRCAQGFFGLHCRVVR